MNYLSLKYFLMVAKELNITRAAKKLYISQQSLSEHIGKLEAEYQVKLFERSPRLELTYAGKRLQELAEQVVDLDAQIDGTMTDISHQRLVNLSVGITPVHGRIILPCILPQFYQDNPNVSLNLSMDNSNRILQLLVEKKLDLVICFHPSMADASIQTAPLIQDKFCLVLPERLLQRYGISLGQLEQDRQELKTVLSQLPFLMSVPGTRIHSAATLFFQDMGIIPHILLEVIDLEAQFSLCKHGMGAMFSFEIFARHRIRESPEEKLYCIPIDTQSVDSELIIAFHRNRYQKTAANSFIQCTRNFFAEEAAERFQVASPVFFLDPFHKATGENL